jgi:hypothetical protein
MAGSSNSRARLMKGPHTSMNNRSVGALPLAVVLLTLALALPTGADPLAGTNLWLARDIGAPAVRGSTSIDANGIWTIKGSGDDIWGTADNFQFVSQLVKGDVTLTARYLSLGGGHPDLAKAGLMVRENETPGSPNVHFHMLRGLGLAATPRLVQDDISGTYLQVGPSARPEPNTLMRLQRAGSEISGFYSRDGILWAEVFGPVILPTLPPEALVGLAVTSHQDGTISTGRFDQVNMQAGAAGVSGLRGCAGDRSVLLQWRPLTNAVAYNVYRGPWGAAPDQLVKRNSVGLTGVSFTDSGDGLENGTPLTYAVAPVFKGADGALLEGPLTVVPVVPQAIPAPFTGCSINEGLNAGGVDFNVATGQITLQGGGIDLISNNGDECYFLSQPVEGDVQITVKALNRPFLITEWSRAGLMIRDSLDAGARQVMLSVSAGQGLISEWRAETDAMTQWLGAPLISKNALQLPILLRLTLRGNTIQPAYSLDGGATFRLAGPRVAFTTALPKTLYVGLAITAADRLRMSQADFASLEIQKQ